MKIINLAKDSNIISAEPERSIAQRKLIFRVKTMNIKHIKIKNNYYGFNPPLAQQQTSVQWHRGLIIRDQ